MYGAPSNFGYKSVAYFFKLVNALTFFLHESTMEFTSANIS